jgi:hypothetical protein
LTMRIKIKARCATDTEVDIQYSICLDLVVRWYWLLTLIVYHYAVVDSGRIT